MKLDDCKSTIATSNVDLARRCLLLISSIALRGACSPDSAHIGYALQELTQVLLERTGNDDRVFEPVLPQQIPGLVKLHEELDFVDGLSQDMQQLENDQCLPS